MPGDTRDEPNSEKLVIYVSPSMLAEINRRAGQEGEEGESRSFVVRKALREFFRRHPNTERSQ